MKKKVANVLNDIRENVFIYVATLSGVLLSKFGPPLIALFKDDRPFQLTKFVALQLAIGVVIAFAIIIHDEQIGMSEDDPEKLAKNKAAKKAAFMKRLRNAFTHGLGWMALVSGMLGIGGGN